MTWAAALLRVSVGVTLSIMVELRGYEALGELAATAERSWTELGTYLQHADAPVWRWTGYLRAFWIFADGLTMLSNDHNRALHDYIAGTIVTRED